MLLAIPVQRHFYAPWAQPNRRFQMGLPKNKASRAKVIKAALALKKLSPKQRKQVMVDGARRRGIQSRHDPEQVTAQSMSDSKTVWVPGGLPENQARALSVPAPGQKPMTKDLYRHLLVQKLDQLIQADPEEAREAMKMSVEQAPEFYSIAQNFPVMDWAIQMVEGDTLMPLLAQVTAKGTLEPEEEQSLRGILEQMP